MAKDFFKGPWNVPNVYPEKRSLFARSFGAVSRIPASILRFKTIRPNCMWYFEEKALIGLCTLKTS